MSKTSGVLKGRVAIVTGASRGIGKAIAERYAAAGATVVLAARSLKHSADELAGTLDEVQRLIAGRDGEAIALACDVENDGNRARLIEDVISRFGRVDILVNNAGRAVLETVDEMHTSVSRGLTEQYLLAPLDLSLRVIPHMKKRGEGWILNLGSHSASNPEGPLDQLLPAEVTLAYYGALKAAVHRMSIGFAIELLSHNIAVNVVAPVGAVLTPGVDAAGIYREDIKQFFEPTEHIAEAALALVSHPPRECTGCVAFSWRYLDQIGRSTMTLDGREVFHERASTA